MREGDTQSNKHTTTNNQISCALRCRQSESIIKKESFRKRRKIQFESRSTRSKVVATQIKHGNTVEVEATELSTAL